MNCQTDIVCFFRHNFDYTVRSFEKIIRDDDAESWETASDLRDLYSEAMEVICEHYPKTYSEDVVLDHASSIFISQYFNYIDMVEKMADYYEKVSEGEFEIVPFEDCIDEIEIVREVEMLSD